MKKLIFIVVILAALFSGYWIFLNSKISNFVDEPAVIADFGFETTPYPKARKGFPLKFSRRWSDVLYTIPALDNGHQWGTIDASDLTISVPSYYPLRYSFKHDGPAKFDLKNEFGDRFIFSVPDLNIFGRYQGKRDLGLTLLEVDIQDLTVDYFAMTPQVIRSANRLSATINRDRDLATGTLHIDNAVLDNTIMQDAGRILGQSITLLDAKCSMTNPDNAFDLGATRSPNTTPVLTCEHVQVEWGPLDIVGTIDLRMDALGPTGSLDLKIKNPQDLAQTLSASGQISSGDFLKFQGMLRMMDTDDEGRIALPLTLKNGQLSFLGMTF